MSRSPLPLLFAVLLAPLMIGCTACPPNPAPGQICIMTGPVDGDGGTAELPDLAGTKITNDGGGTYSQPKVPCASLLPDLEQCWLMYKDKVARTTCAEAVWMRYSTDFGYDYYKNQGNKIRWLSICINNNCNGRARPSQACSEPSCNDTGDPTVDCCPVYTQCMNEK